MDVSHLRVLTFHSFKHHWHARCASGVCIRSSYAFSCLARHTSTMALDQLSTVLSGYAAVCRHRHHPQITPAKLVLKRTSLPSTAPYQSHYSQNCNSPQHNNTCPHRHSNGLSNNCSAQSIQALWNGRLMSCIWPYRALAEMVGSVLIWTLVIFSMKAPIAAGSLI